MPDHTSIQPIDPVSDPRVAHKAALLNGVTYHYLYGEPKNGQVKATIFLIHGWPDLCVGWRYQIPFLLDMGFRVVVPDMMGYGGTVSLAGLLLFACHTRYCKDSLTSGASSFLAGSGESRARAASLAELQNRLN